MLVITEKAGTPICIEDNLLDEDTFFELQAYMSTLENRKHKIDEGHLFYEPLMKIFKKNIYHHREILRDRVNNKRSNLSDKKEDCVFQIILRSMGHKPKGDKKIHLDNSWKILSSIMYVGPEESVGTVFVDSEDSEEEHEVEWKTNRIVSFIPSESSWHSYRNDSIIPRHTVQFILSNREDYKEL